MNEPSRLGRFSYEPTKVIGTCRASRPDTLGLAFHGLVLGEVQGRLPSSGTLILLGGHTSKVKLAGKYRKVRRIVDALRVWTGSPVADTPPVVLNKHCPSCPFRDACLQQAEREDNLSLLARMTPKLMRKYQDKGIFTVRQLSHAGPAGPVDQPACTRATPLLTRVACFRTRSLWARRAASHSI